MNNRVMKSFVWHGDKCFFVSTIERDSSAAIAPMRYNETIVWEYDYTTNTRGELIWSGEDARGSIVTHIKCCARIHNTGIPEEPESE